MPKMQKIKTREAQEMHKHRPTVAQTQTACKTRCFCSAALAFLPLLGQLIGRPRGASLRQHRNAREECIERGGGGLGFRFRREGGKEGGREGGKEGGREGGKEGGKEGGREGRGVVKCRGRETGVGLGEGGWERGIATEWYSEKE